MSQSLTWLIHYTNFCLLFSSNTIFIEVEKHEGSICCNKCIHHKEEIDINCMGRTIHMLSVKHSEFTHTHTHTLSKYIIIIICHPTPNHIIRGRVITVLYGIPRCVAACLTQTIRAIKEDLRLHYNFITVPFITYSCTYCSVSLIRGRREVKGFSMCRGYECLPLS